LIEIDKLIKKYGFTRFIQMFSRQYEFNFLLNKDYQPILKTKSSGVKNLIKTYKKIKKKIKN
jgi:hypothetical protein